MMILIHLPTQVSEERKASTGKKSSIFCEEILKTRILNAKF